MRFKQRSGIEQQRVVALMVGLLVVLAFYGITANSHPTPATSTTTTTSSQSTSSTQTSTVGTSSGPNDGTFGSHTGVMIPFYLGVSSPGFASDLSEILAEKTAFMSVPMIVIINPDSGVGTQSSTMLTAVQEMQAENIYVIGYDWTGYGILNTPYTPGGNPYVTLADIQQNMTDYSNWYHVQGTFFDGMAINPAYANFYSSLSLYANGLGQQYTIGNPGTDTVAAYIPTVTSMVVYEGPTLPDVTCSSGTNPPPCLVTPWHAQYSKYSFALIGFDQPQVAQSYVQAAAAAVGWMYITDNTGCPNQGFYNTASNTPCGPGVAVNPYNTLPSYLTAEMADIASYSGP